jgi:hypothetical protein
LAQGRRLGGGGIMYSKNHKIEPSGNGYNLFVVDAEIDKLFQKHAGNVNVTIKSPVSKGTEEQNRAMHSLLTEFWKTGMHSAPDGTPLEVFKIYCKILYGVVYTIMVDGKEKTIPKSWGDYTKLERTDFIEKLLHDIHESGAFTESEKIREIVKGMEDAIY